MPPGQRRSLLLLMLVLAAVAAVYLLRLDEVGGMMVDDAWYIVLAKALADGQGYRLISSATTEILPAVPPGFPALLVPIVLAVPAFPDHVVWMKLLSIVALFAAAVVYWRDLVQQRQLAPAHATLLVVVTLLCPSLLFLATSTVMSDCVFLLAQMAAIVATERIVRQDQHDWRSPAIAGMLTAIAMLVRTAAAALIAGAIVYLVIARRPRQAAVFAGAVGACLLPWMLYAASHAPSDEERSMHGGTIAYSYTQLLSASRLSDLASGPAETASIAGRIVQNMTVVFTRDLGAVFVPSLYRGPEESGQEVFSIGRPEMGDMGITTGTMIVSSLIAAIVVLGWLGSGRERVGLPGLVMAATLPMIAPVAGQTYRYLLPLTPYLMWFFWNGLRSARLARVVFLTLLGLQVIDHAGYIRQKLTTTTEWIADFHETRELTAWIAGHVPADRFVASTNPGLIYLDTNRRTIAIDGLPRNWQRWKASGVRFVASNTAGKELPSRSLGWRLRFRSDQRRLWVVEMVD